MGVSDSVFNLLQPIGHSRLISFCKVHLQPPLYYIYYVGGRRKCEIGYSQE